MIRSSCVFCAYMYFRFLTTSIFYHYKVGNEAFSLLYALFSPLWSWPFYSIVQRVPFGFKKILHLRPIPIILLLPHIVQRSHSGCLLFQLLNSNHPLTLLPLAFYTFVCTSNAISLRTFSASLVSYSSTLETY